MVFDLFFHDAVYLDACIGTHRGASSTADAGFGMLREREMITSVVDLFGLEEQHIGRAGNYAKFASLAALLVDRNGSMNFCHRREMWGLVKQYGI